MTSSLGSHLYFEGSPEVVESASELFEIDDFTSPSAWEKFVSQFEQILRDWNLHKPSRVMSAREDVSSCSWAWKSQSRTLIYHEFEFLVTEHKKYDPNVKEAFEEEEFESEEGQKPRSWRGSTPDYVNALVLPGSFPSQKCHPLHAYYGLNHFIVLSPSKREKEEIDNETRAKMALSTLAVALSNTNCAVPCFVQVMDRYKVIFFNFKRYRSSC